MRQSNAAFINAIYVNECLPDTHCASPQTQTEIHTLIGCPPIPFGARYKLVGKRNGKSTTIGIGRAQSKAPSLNLANIRRRGAKMGATEVHVIR